MTDVTGFGLLGHLLEMCRGSHVGAMIDFSQLPLHPGVLDLAAKGLVTGASRRNFDAYSDQVTFAASLGDAERALLTDPQTSGGLLVACAPEIVHDVLDVFRHEGFASATKIGRFKSGEPRVDVR